MLPDVDRALRIDIRGFSPDAHTDLFVIPNMRAPPSSPVRRTHQSSEAISAFERLSQWCTSDGMRLKGVTVLTSSFSYRDSVFALISI